MTDPTRTRQWTALLCLWALLVLTLTPPVLAQDSKADGAKKRLLAAQGFLRGGNYKFARDEFRKFVNDYPQHAEATDAKFWLGWCEHRLFEYAKAVTLMEAALADSKFKRRDDALVVLGHSRMSLGENEKALAAFEQILKDHATSKQRPFAALYRARVLYDLGRKEDALAASGNFVSGYPTSGNLDAGMYIQALCQYDLGKHAESAATLKKLFTSKPNTRYWLDATHLLGQCQTELNQLDEAVASFTKMLEKAPITRQAQGRYSLGVALYKGAKYDESIKQFATILKDYATDRYAAPARLQLGLAQLAANDPNDARKTLQAVVKDDDKRAVTARYWLAQCDIRQSKYADARKILDALHAMSPPPSNLDQITYDRALCQLNLGNHAEAAKEFAAFRTKFASSPQFADATYRQAFCLHKTEQYDESLKLCQAVAQLQGASTASAKAPAAKLAAENLFLLRRYDDAATAFTALNKNVEDDDDRRHFTFRLGQCASLSGDFDKAITLLTPLDADEAVLNDKRFREAIMTLGDAYLQTKQYDKAETAIAKYVKASGTKSPEPNYKLGRAQLRSGKTAEAAATLKTVASGSADELYVQYALLAYGELMYQQKKPQDASPSLAKVVAAKAPADLTAPAMYLLAFIDADARKFKSAADRFAGVVTQFTAVTDVSDNTKSIVADSLFHQGVNLKLADETEKALTTLQQYVTKYPTGQHQREAKYQAGTCLAKLDKHEDALKLFEPLAASDESRTDTLLYDLAWSYRATKANDKAETRYRQLLKEYPQSDLLTATRVELADLVYELDEYEEAAGLLEEALKDTDGPAETLAVAQYRLGLCYDSLKQHAKAAPVFSAFATKHPQNDLTPSALYQAGEAYAELGKWEEAQTHLAKVVTQHPTYTDIAVARLKLGQVQNEAGKFPNAATTMQAFLKNHADSEFAYLAQFGLGWALENQKQYEQARTWYTKVIDANNTETAARSQFQLGETFLKEGKFEEAARELLKVELVYDYPEWSARALYEAGQAFEQMKDLDQAKAHYQKVVTKYKDRPIAETCRKRLASLN